MGMRIRVAAVAALIAFAGGVIAGPIPGHGTWEATLQPRDLDGNLSNGPEAFYDTEFNITWLAAGSPSGMDWASAVNWASQQRYGLSGWRLPTLVDKGGCNASPNDTCGANPDTSKATGSELAHLYYVTLGNIANVDKGGTPQSGYGLLNTGDFQNLQLAMYWTGVGRWEYPGPQYLVYQFNMIGGGQGTGNRLDVLDYAMAVRDGDVLSAVPEPSTYSMVVLGLVAVSGVASRRRHVLVKA